MAQERDDGQEAPSAGSTAAEALETSRRNFMKGGTALASSAAMLRHPGFVDSAKAVPNEPTNGGKVRQFTIHAIEVDLVYNRYGLHQPNAAIYVLEENLSEAREASGKIPCSNKLVQQDHPFCDDIPEEERGDTSILQPLVIRANQGDVIEIEFVNDLDDRRASMHPSALPYEVEENDGMDVGFNPDTTVPPGESITYRWFADGLGAHFFLDGANQAFDSAEDPPQEANGVSRGLFGAVVVLPQGTTYTDPYSGKPLRSGVQADIHVPDQLSEEAIGNGYVPGIDFRQIIPFYHSPVGVVTADGGEPTWPGSDEPQETHAINYRADPTGSRIDPDRCPACGSTEFYSSWIHGDPGGGDNVYPVYLGDPTKFIAIGASIEENHVHHLHGHRWKEIPPEDGSDTIDSQTIGLGAVYEAPQVPAFGEPNAGINDFQTVRPDMTYQEAFQVGAGGAHGSPGDFLFHCHLFPHYGEGMWGIFRVLDKEHEGLQKLPNNDPPIPQGSDISGYPDFIPGEFENAPPFPPYDDIREFTEEERRALTRDGEIIPGAPYTDPCDPDMFAGTGYDGPPSAVEGEKREYTIVALRADVVYNDAGDHDPEGRVYVLEEDAEAVREGRMNPEPLVIRANVGDCVEITLKNEIEEDVFPVPTAGGGPDLAGGKSNHIHFVSYDVLGSDSLATGFNYNQQSLPDQPLKFRWFADEEGLIFFHDHITGIENIMNGTFAALIVEPPNSKWLDPYTSAPIRSGTQAMIQTPDGDDFREFALCYQDFAQLVDRDGEFVNPNREHTENAGVMAINYRNAPYYHRDDADPAYVHSSFVHGDPATPVPEAYEGDPIRMRVWQATYEEQHSFTTHGRRFDPEGFSLQDAVSQVIGTSEAFTFDLRPEEVIEEERRDENPLLTNPSGLPIRDYLYGSTVVDDLWDGMWGIQRLYSASVDHLCPLPDRGRPEGKISNEELKEAGIPAAFDDRDSIGQKARLLYDENDDRTFPPDKDARQNESIPESPPPRAPRPGNPFPTRRRRNDSALPPSKLRSRTTSTATKIRTASCLRSTSTSRPSKTERSRRRRSRSG